MAYFKVVLKGGHMGAGKSYDMVRYCQAGDVLSAFSRALSLSRVKKSPHGTAVYSVEKVAEEEYRLGKVRERSDPYLRRRQRFEGKACTFRK